MSPLFKFSSAALFTTLLAACASVSNSGLNSTYTTSSSEPGSYFESSFNDHNPAPKSMSPPSLSGDDQARLDPLYLRTQADYFYSIGEAFSMEGHRQKAIESFKMTLLYDPEAFTVRLRLASEYMRAGMISEAIEQALEVTKKKPKNIEAHLLLGGLYSTLRQYPKAIEHYETVVRIQPENNEAPIYLGAVYSEQKQYDKAVKFFESVAKRSDINNGHLLYYYIGRVRLDQPEIKYQKAAEEAFRKSLSIKPSFVDSLIALSALYSKQKKEKESLALLVQFQKNHGPNQRVAEILAQFYIENEKFDEAYEQLEYLEASDDSLNVKMKLGLILLERGVLDRAAQKFEDVLQEAPESDKARFFLSLTYARSKQPDKAVSNFKKIAIGPYYDQAQAQAAYLLKTEGQSDDGLKLLEKPVNEKKAGPKILTMYASFLDERGETKKALQVLENNIPNFPKDTELHFYFGTLHDKLGDKKKVVEVMKGILQIDPMHVQGINYLAYTYAEQGENLEEAEQLARRAVKIEPKDGYVMDTLGWVLFKRGHLDESIRILEAAFKNQPSVGVIAEHLGDAYFKKTLTDRALKMYNRALDLETDPRRIEEIRQKITSIDDQKSMDRAPASK